MRKKKKFDGYKKNVLYMRYSTHNQDDGFSIEYQSSEINEYAQKHGFTIDEQFIDEAKTGTKVAGRDGFYNMVRAVKDGLVKVIIVYKLSRLFRDATESQYYRDLFRKHEVKLISVTEHINEETSSGRMTTSILSVVDQYQTEITSDHVKSSMREMARQGFYTGGLPLYGYDLESIPHGKKPRKRFVPNDTEARIVNKIFELYANGYEVGYIRRYLNDTLNVRTKRNGLFSVQSIHRILKNDSYLGIRRFETQGYDEMIIEDSHPAIISKSLWNAVEERRESRPKINPRKHPEKRTYPLTGKVFCSCGSHCIGISGTNKRRKSNNIYEYHYYRCAFRNSYNKCNVTSIRREVLHKTVMNEIKTNFLNEARINELSAEIEKASNAPSESVENRMKLLTAEKRQIEKDLNMLIDMRLNNEMSGDILRKRSEPLEERLPKIEKQIYALKNQQKMNYTFDEVKSYLLDLLAKTEIDDDEILRSIFDTFVEKVTVSNTKIEVILKMSNPPKEVLFNITSGTPFVTLNKTLYRH